MPRPKDLAELVVIEDGAPDFRRGPWWDVFKLARVFIVTGYEEAMQLAGLNTSQPIVAKLKGAYERISTETSWLKDYDGKKQWESTASSQVFLATHGEAMLLTKAAVCIEALQLAADEREVKNFDVYDIVNVVPAAYAIRNFNPEVLASLKEDGLAAQIANAIEDSFALEHSGRILTDMANGNYVTYSIAKSVLDLLPKPRQFSIVPAFRPGQQGVKPASSSLKLQ